MLVWKWFLYSRHKSQQLFIHNISLQQSTSILLLFAFSSSAQHKPEAGPFIPDAYFWLSHTHIHVCVCAHVLVPSPLEHLCRRVYDDVNFPVFVRNWTLFGSDSSQLGGGGMWNVADLTSCWKGSVAAAAAAILCILFGWCMYNAKVATQMPPKTKKEMQTHSQQSSLGSTVE
jgi:hypothetical protein